MKKDVVLQPSFFDEFECIGSDCKNSCCAYYWGIDFTKEEFKNVKKKMHTDEFKEVFQNAFTFQKGKYRIKLDEKGRCKFLNEDGLCKIYMEVGHDNMANVCKIFPRRITRYVNGYERFLSIGCERVVDLLLEQKDGLQLEVVEKEVSPLEKNRAVLCSGIEVEQSKQLQLWNDMKVLLLSVLQCREYRFGERMVLLGLATQKIQKMFEQKQIEEIQKYIQNFIAEIEQNEQVYTEFFEKINRNGKIRAFQASMYHLPNLKGSAIEQKIKERIDLKQQHELVPKSEENNNMEMELSLSTEYDNKKYQQAIADFEEFLKDKEYWLENVMIEGFLASKGFYRVKGGFWRNYCAMAVTYSVILFVLTCCLEKDSTKEDFKKYVTEIARTMFHNEQHTKNLEEHLKETESDSLAHIAVLVL